MAYMKGRTIMELSMSLNYLQKTRRADETRALESAAEMCRNAGFRYVDYTPEFMAEDWETQAYRAREILDRAGIAVEQTHVPINRYGAYDPEAFPVYYRRVFEASKIVGAKYVVVHADEYRTTDRYDVDEIMDFTYDYLSPYVDFAAKNDMVVAVENVFEDNIRSCPQIGGKSRFTSRIDELKGIIERFNTKSVKCCWDFGHAKCAFGNDDMLDAFKEVGQYLCCTHVHDNYYGKDLHLMPFLGEIDWESHLAYMREIGYGGKLSFEFVYGRFPEKLLPVWLNSVYAVGEYMIGLFENREA